MTFLSTVVKCDQKDLFHPDHGSVDCAHPNGEFSYESQCEYSCDMGYQLFGSQMTRCQAAATWSNKPPSCKRK